MILLVGSLVGWSSGFGVSDANASSQVAQNPFPLEDHVRLSYEYLSNLFALNQSI